MFRGNHPTRVDEKGRLKVPAEFKRVIDEKYGQQFYITSLDGKVAQVYPFEEWERIEQKLAGLSTFNPTKKKFLERVNYWGQQVEMDGQGRLLMPQLLRDAAQIKGEVAVLGNLTYLEVRNLEAFRKQIEEQQFTPEDEKHAQRAGHLVADGLDIPERGGHGGAESGHVTVLLKEAIDFLAVRRGGTYIDATVGLGGHSYEIAKRLGAQGRLIGVDKDPAALEIARERLVVGAGAGDWPAIELRHGSFSELANDQRRRPTTGRRNSGRRWSKQSSAQHTQREALVFRRKGHWTCE